jgi:hypothetical protein
MTTTWNVNVTTGKKFVLVYVGKDGKLAGSGTIEVRTGGEFGSECLMSRSNQPSSSASAVHAKFELAGLFLLGALALTLVV